MLFLVAAFIDPFPELCDPRSINSRNSLWEHKSQNLLASGPSGPLPIKQGGKHRQLQFKSTCSPTRERLIVCSVVSLKTDADPCEKHQKSSSFRSSPLTTSMDIYRNFLLTAPTPLLLLAFRVLQPHSAICVSSLHP